jgi:glycyl-tRNA synthetase alpha chain
VESVYDIRWSKDMTYGQIRLAEEQQLSEYSFDRSDAKALRAELELHEKEAKELLDGWKQLVGPPPKSSSGFTPLPEGVPAAAERGGGAGMSSRIDAPHRAVGVGENVGAPTKQRYPLLAAYDHCLKCSHLFNLMDARGVISTTERAALMQRVRTLACRTAAAYLDQIGAKASANVGAPTKPTPPGLPHRPEVRP